MRGYVGVLLSIYVFKQIQILDAYILSCNASLQTITHVTMCPSDISAYEEAVQKKNCSSLAPDTQTCQSFQYHCVLSDDLKNAIEVCAPSMLIIGHVCTKFSTRYRSIMRIAGFPCNDSAITCPYGYNSTQAFLHTLCYAKISGQFTSDIPLSKEGVTNRDTREKDKEKINNSKLWWILLVPVVLITVSLVGVLLSSYCKRRNTVRRRKGISAISFQASYPLLLEEQNPPINDTTLSHEESPQKEQSNTKNDSCYQASTKSTLNASSERDRLMLECLVNLLIRHLRDPDESWTKEMIISHVENMIQRLVNSNEEELLISFIKRLNNDKGIATTLLRCGEKMFELVSSIQEKYAARKIAITLQSCITFSFANVNDLENYLEKVRNKDEQLTTDLSRILLNKTLLSIFYINPTLVRWNASELKVFKGSQLLKTETFQEPLTGSSKDFIGISKDYAPETYKETPYSELTEGSADFKKKCDMFSSKETSKFPGYRKYKTRAMSFDGADKRLEVKKEEFAKYGFLYKGVGSKTNCFHCGCLKDDWTEEDDILSTHVFLEKSCAYVQYIMEQELNELKTMSVSGKSQS